MYKFKKIDGDKFSLIYEKDNSKKQIEFKRTVKMATRLQAVDSEARFRVMMQLTEKGYTIDNNPFVIEKKEGNKTIRDESNLNYLINKEKETTIAIIITELIKEAFEMDFDVLIPEIGIDPSNRDDVVKFTQDFMYIIKNGETSDTEKTPSPKD
jgi:hypothetical protein